MKRFCKEFSDKHKVDIAFDNQGDQLNLPPEISVCLLRILQESLHNALKHSGVRRFEVTLQGSPTVIQLTVRDSRVGFDPELTMSTQGLGLISMRERIKLVQGTISITSRPLSGTEVSVRVPLPAGTRTEQARKAGA